MPTRTRYREHSPSSPSRVLLILQRDQCWPDDLLFICATLSGTTGMEYCRSVRGYNWAMAWSVEELPYERSFLTADTPVHPMLSSLLKVAVDELHPQVGCACWIRCLFAFIKRSNRRFVGPLLGHVGCWRLQPGSSTSAALVVD